MISRWIIYGLTDPRTGAVRYIGKSSTGMKRPEQHGDRRDVARPSLKLNWLKSLLALGLRWGVLVLEELPSAASLNAAERRWIAHGRAQGWPLTNATEGGDDGAMPPDSIERMRAKKRGVTLTAEHRAKIRAAFTPEKRAELAARKRGRTLTLEHRVAIGAAGRGRMKSPESSAKAWATRRAKATMNMNTAVGA